MLLFSVLTRKAKVPKHNFYPPRSASWLRGGRFQLAASSGPGSETLPSCHHWRSQVPTQLALRLLRPPKVGETKCHRLQRRQIATAIRSQRQGLGEAHRCLKAWAKAGGWPWWGPQPHSVLWGPQITHCPSGSYSATGQCLSGSLPLAANCQCANLAVLSVLQWGLSTSNRWSRNDS